MAKKKVSKSLTECPNCGSMWGIGSEEYDWQECDACGWPDNDHDEYNEDEYDLDEFDDDSNDPNDSRNL